MNANNILIADDEPHVARILKMSLQQAGYQVMYVNNGQKALDAYKEHRPDVVITDVKMPQMSGRELVENIRSIDGGSLTPVIVMTSTLQSENRDWVEKVGNVFFVGKPVSPRSLISFVNGFFAQDKAS